MPKLLTFPDAQTWRPSAIENHQTKRDLCIEVARRGSCGADLSSGKRIRGGLSAALLIRYSGPPLSWSVDRVTAIARVLGDVQIGAPSITVKVCRS